MQAPSKKRVFDLAVAGLGASVWLPALVICAFAIWLMEGRPVFYVSLRRVGHKAIPMVKFRTMIRNADKVYNRETVPVSNSVRFLNTPADSPLYTSIGRLIERLSLTEIPQFIHVLRGEMSIVGNRPLPENVIGALEECFPHIHDRFLTPSGMMGPVQLIGRESLSDADRIMIEAAYCRKVLDSYSWWLDLSIVLKTVLIALRLTRPLSVEDVRHQLLACAREPSGRGV